MTDQNADFGSLDDDIGVEEQERWEGTVVNDAVAGETVWPGPGDGNDGPTGGTTHEQEPIAAENDLAGEEVSLGDRSDDL